MIRSGHSHLQEAKQVGTLYRTIDIRYLKETLSGTLDTVSGVICMTRDKMYHKTRRLHGITLIIDGDKLSNNYKVYPYMNPGEDRLKYNEAEVRVDKPIKNFRKYLLGVSIPKQYRSADNEVLNILLDQAGFDSSEDLHSYVSKFTKNINYF